MHRRAWRLFRHLDRLRPRWRLRLLFVLVCLGAGFGMVSPAHATDTGSSGGTVRPPAAARLLRPSTVASSTSSSSPASTWPAVLPASARADLPRGIPTDDDPADPPILTPAGAASTSPESDPQPVAVPAGGPLPGAAPGGPDCAVARCVALTFDDGPGPATPRLLDLLARARVPATFFVIGRQIGGNEAVLQRMIRDGHVVGNHTWSHPSLARIPAEATRAQVAATDAAILAATGVRPTVMRPPYGAMAAAATQVGQAVVLWDVDTLDWKHRVSSSVTERALASARAGSIVLMHDIHPSTVDAVPAIIAGLRAKGYTLVTVPQLLGQLRAGAVYPRR